jgi:hypothetical protein
MNLKEIGMFANACAAFTSTRVGARHSGFQKDIKSIQTLARQNSF